MKLKSRVSKFGHNDERAIGWANKGNECLRRDGESEGNGRNG